jgi:excisionase family DNA binding protein
MEKPLAAVAPADPTVGVLYTTQQVAKMLQVSQGTVQNWVHTGLLQAVRYGRIVRIRQEDLAAFGEVVPRRTPPGAAE